MLEKWKLADDKREKVQMIKEWTGIDADIM